MKHQIQNPLNLAAYAVLAGSFLAFGKETAAQAVYVDIDPDTVLTAEPVEFFLLELNNKWAQDYIFGIGAGTYYADWCECYVFGRGVDLGGTESKVVYTNYQFSSDQYLASALDFGVMINEDLNFRDNDTKMAYKIIPDWSFYYVFEGGAWYPEAIDKYVGIRFTDTLDCLHYGWIRCSVEDGGSKITIKDYAYETKCDVGIAAGDMIGDTTVAIEDVNTLNALVYSFEKTIYINNLNFTDCTIVIYNLQGQDVISQKIMQPNTIINMDQLPPGIYLLKLTSEDKIYSKELNIN
ncbi:MAG TPA: T9SS type A sorting domain-containing protein [Chitinophagales bacterium]|nr:T9SS type A sorting domain-containing protein [Chitinophagales bacterium]HNI55835.1 T9SS type A sorting domain-containing protein [Chitinophagales bacterium]HNK62136.1 T9SS type A sorting domain-containing protein [Chitinophagaceae bacterium]HNM30866.1 T9SS type A sorting domain-containing protein [Chitinophagales bacterium]